MRHTGYHGSAMMVSVQGLVRCFSVCALFFSGCRTQVSSYGSHPPVYVWPLGSSILGLELNTQVRECDKNNLDKGSGTETLLYDAMEFKQDLSSNIDLHVAHEPRLDGDTAFSFHLYPESDGTVFHYKSYSMTEMGVTEIEIKIVSGAFVTNISLNDGSSLTRTTSVGLSNVWYRIVVERDVSTDHVVFYVEKSGGTTSYQTIFAPWLVDKKTVFPGQLRLGGDQAGVSFFQGRLACLQLVDIKDPRLAAEYDAECLQDLWPKRSAVKAMGLATCSELTTTTTTTTTTTKPTTTSTTTTSTSTSTTPSTTQTTTTTPSTSTTMMTTSTTTPAITTTSTLPTPATPALPSFVPAISSTTLGCSHLAATPGATYLFPGDVLQTAVLDLQACVWLCVRDGECGSFVYSGGLCQTGVISPLLVSDVNKTMYVLQ